MEEFAKFAIVHEGKVAGMIAFKTDDQASVAIRSGGQLIETKTEVMTGWTWDGSTFIPPAE